MNFAEEAMTVEDGFICGEYESLPIASLPSLYVSFSTEFGEPTEIFHNNLRFRYDSGEPSVVEAMRKFADLTRQAREVLLAGESEKLGPLLDRNFDLRRSICQLPKEHVLMVETARACGASAKFAGSGGAIVGTYPDESAFDKLREEMKKIGCETVKPLM